LRHERSLTQAGLARQLEVWRGHINNIEAGRRVPSLDFVLRTAHFFGVATDYFLLDSILPESVADWTVPPVETHPFSLDLFAANLRRLRTDRHLTQSELAHRLGLGSHSHVSYLESGKNEPSIDLVLRIVEAFGVTTDALLRESHA
jgi:transcriptional regulator with XRE-family HTH domain